MAVAGSDEKGRPIFRDVIDPNGFAVRQNLIKQIESQIGAALVTYTANAGIPGSGIMVQDAILLEDILRSVSDQKKGVLMLTSPGGDPNAAEKMMQMFRKRFTQRFEIIVPYYAKSAATLMCLGADKICMGYCSELGPVDPQIQMPNTNQLVPARAYIDGLESIRKKVKEEGDPVTLYYSMLQQVRPEYLAICKTAIDDSRETAAKWLKQYMLKDNPEQAERVSLWLTEGKTYKSHGKPIDYQEAKDILKLNVDEIDNTSGLWHLIWELLTRSLWFLQNAPGPSAKLFESNSNSLNMTVAVQQKQ